MLSNKIFLAIPFVFAFVGPLEANNYSEEEINCLALNVYHESRGEDYTGRIAVAYTTMNRVEHDYFPDSICGVVWEDNQFSWTNDGRSDAANNQQSWIESLDVAHLVLQNEVDDPTNGALFYHATYINRPSWTETLDIALEHGIHVFYHWDGNW